MTADGGPNLDEFEFDVEGVRLWDLADTALVFEDTTETESGIADIRTHSLVALSASRNGIAYRVPVSFATLFVFDLNGNVVLKQVVSGQGVITQEWDVLPAGRYTLAVRQNGKFLTKTSAVKF